MTTLPRRSLGVLAAGLAASLALHARDARADTSRGDSLLRTWDTDHDGTLDLNEVQQAATARFNQMDTDHDGTLDRKDRGRNLVMADFRAADADHDGSVTLDEYLALVQTRFEAADANHDGTLDSRELHSNAGRTLMRLLK
jgi:Ca2+-binding EF-hand superfamily protein